MNNSAFRSQGFSRFLLQPPRLKPRLPNTEWEFILLQPLSLSSYPVNGQKLCFFPKGLLSPDYQIRGDVAMPPEQTDKSVIYLRVEYTKNLRHPFFFKPIQKGFDRLCLCHAS